MAKWEIDGWIEFDDLYQKYQYQVDLLRKSLSKESTVAVCAMQAWDQLFDATCATLGYILVHNFDLLGQTQKFFLLQVPLFWRTKYQINNLQK